MHNLGHFFPTWAHVVVIPGLVVGFVVHELGHALVTYWLGDSSPVRQGRMTFNPLRHVFWLGFLTFVFFGFGWARPVRVDARRFKSPFGGVCLVALSGAIANLAWALVVAIATLVLVSVVALFSRYGAFELLGNLTADVNSQPAILGWTAAFTTQVVYCNVALAFFNLLPLPGLDGFAVIVGMIGWLRSQPEGSQPGRSADAEASDHADAIAAVLPEGLRTGSEETPADIHFGRGLEYQVAGQYEDAIARYRQAIRQDERYGPAYIGMGQSFLAMGQTTRAEHAFKGAVQYANEDRSRQMGWASLHRLKRTERVVVGETGGEPHPERPPAAVPTDDGSQATVNWVRFRSEAALFFVGNSVVWIGLALGLIWRFA